MILKVHTINGIEYNIETRVALEDGYERPFTEAEEKLIPTVEHLVLTKERADVQATEKSDSQKIEELRQNLQFIAQASNVVMPEELA